MTESEGARKLDLAAKASINLVDLNNKVVLMRKIVRRAKIFVIRGLTRKLKALRNKKGNDAEKQRNQTKADKLVEEIRLIHTLKADYVSKYALGSTEKFQDIVAKPTTTMEMRALARLAENKVILDVVKDFREKHHDWKDLAAYLMTKHTSRDFKKKKTKTKKSKVKVNVEASETLVKTYLSSKLGDAVDTEHSIDDEAEELENSDAEDGEYESESDDSESQPPSRHASQKVDTDDDGDSDEEEEEAEIDNESSDSDDGDNEMPRKQAMQQIVKDKDEVASDEEEEEEEEEDNESADSDDNDNNDNQTEALVNDESDDSEGESDSGEEVCSDKDDIEKSDSEVEDGESNVEGETSSEVERMHESQSDTDSPNESINTDKSKVDKFSKLLFQGSKGKGVGDRKRTLDSSPKPSVHITKDVEKKSGDMIVKRLKLTEDTVEDKSEVPDILLGLKKEEPTKKKRKRKDPFFDSGVDNGSDSDGDTEDKATFKNWSKDTEKATKFDFMSEKEMGMKALSTTFVESLNSGKMMECNDPAYRTNAEWKQIREDKTGSQGPRNFRGRGGGRGDFRGRGRGDFRGRGRGDFRGRGRGDFGSRGRGDFRGRGRGRGDFQGRGRGDPRGRGAGREGFSRGGQRGDFKGLGHNKPSFQQDKGKAKPAEKTGPLHPSWEASKKKKQMAASIHTYTGKKTTFDD